MVTAAVDTATKCIILHFALMDMGTVTAAATSNITISLVTLVVLVQALVQVVAFILLELLAVIKMGLTCNTFIVEDLPPILPQLVVTMDMDITALAFIIIKDITHSLVKRGFIPFILVVVRGIDLGFANTLLDSVIPW